MGISIFRIITVMALTVGLMAAGCEPETPQEPEIVRIPLAGEKSGPSEAVEKETREAVFRKVPEALLPVFIDDLDFADLKDAIAGSLAWYRRLPPDTAIAYGSDTYSAGQLADGLERFLHLTENKPSPGSLQEEITRHFHVYGFFQDDRPQEVLFTGYYEPLLRGSLVPDEIFRYPIYGRPRDLVTINLADFSPDLPKEILVGRQEGRAMVPYFSREQIDADAAFAGMADPIAWVDDPVDLFFLHVQGSGRLELAGGEIRHVHFHISNGLAYRSIGKYLIDAGKIPREEVTMPAIRSYLKSHPEEMRRIFDYNPRYIFFQTRDHGPKGCFAIELTPGRSVALDRKLFPPAGLAFVRSRKPVTDSEGVIREWTDFSRFVLNHDTGSAIAGPGRADIFWGHGQYAEIAAGHMKHPGQLFFLAAKAPRE